MASLMQYFVENNDLQKSIVMEPMNHKEMHHQDKDHQQHEQMHHEHSHEIADLKIKLIVSIINCP